MKTIHTVCTSSVEHVVLKYFSIRLPEHVYTNTKILFWKRFPWTVNLLTSGTYAQELLLHASLKYV